MPVLGQCRSQCPRQPSLFCVNGQCPYSVFTANAPDSPVCSVLTVNARIGSMPYSVFTVSAPDRTYGLFRSPDRILCSRSMPQTAQSVLGQCRILCSRSVPYGVAWPYAPDSPVCYVFMVNAPDSPVCVLGQSVRSTAQSVFCVHGTMLVGYVSFVARPIWVGGGEVTGEGVRWLAGRRCPAKHFTPADITVTHPHGEFIKGA